MFSSYVDSFLERIGVSKNSLDFIAEPADAEQKCLEQLEILFVKERLPIEDIQFIDADPMKFAVRKGFRRLVEALLDLRVVASEVVIQQMYHTQMTFDPYLIRRAVIGAIGSNPSLVVVFADILLSEQVFGRETGPALLRDMLGRARPLLQLPDYAKLATSALHTLDVSLLRGIKEMSSADDIISSVFKGDSCSRVMRHLTHEPAHSIESLVNQLEDIIGID
jgi:hypothetical protein